MWHWRSVVDMSYLLTSDWTRLRCALHS